MKKALLFIAALFASNAFAIGLGNDNQSQNQGQAQGHPCPLIHSIPYRSKTP